MAIKELLPDIRPTLLLDFANTKKLDPRITFSRTSTATYYDGKTVAKAEENLLTRSQEFETGWAYGNTTITSNSVAAPDGTTTADTVTATANTNTDATVGKFSLSSTSGLDYVISFFAKAGTYSAFQITNGNFQASSAYATFDLSAGTVGASGNCTASIQSVGNSWYRCIVIFSATTTRADGAVYACLAANTSASRLQKWSPVGTESIYLWGAQLEQRSSVTAYTATTTQPITNYIPVLQTAPAGVPRFDHNPVTEESLGLLIEEQRTNLLTYSEQFDNATWTANNAVVADTNVAPNGALAGDTFIPTAGSTFASISTASSQAKNGTYTASVYLKSGGATFAGVQVSAFSGNAVNTFINLTTGETSIRNDGAGSGATAFATSVGNGWWRVAVSGIPKSGDATNGIALNVGVAGSLNSYTFAAANGYSGIYIWGAQLEAGAFPTSYIKTEASQVTRAADAAVMTGENFSSWYRPDEGALYSEFSTASPSSINGVFATNDNTSSNQVGLRSQSSNPRLLVNVGGATQASISAGAMPSAGVALKLAGAYKTNDFSAALNGVSAVTDNSGTVPAVTQARFGALDNGTNFLNGHIRKIAYYPRRLTNDQLQALTA